MWWGCEASLAKLDACRVTEGGDMDGGRRLSGSWSSDEG